MAARTSPRRMPERIPIEERQVLCIDEACRWLGISQPTLKRLEREGVIRRVQGLGKPVRYAKSEIARVLGEVPGAASAGEGVPITVGANGAALRGLDDCGGSGTAKLDRDSAGMVMIPRVCACGCGRSFTPPPQAPHKRFYAPDHRERFWQVNRKKEAKG